VLGDGGLDFAANRTLLNSIRFGGAWLKVEIRLCPVLLRFLCDGQLMFVDDCKYSMIRGSPEACGVSTVPRLALYTLAGQLVW